MYSEGLGVAVSEMGVEWTMASNDLTLLSPIHPHDAPQWVNIPAEGRRFPDPRDPARWVPILVAPITSATVDMASTRIGWRFLLFAALRGE